MPAWKKDARWRRQWWYNNNNNIYVQLAHCRIQSTSLWLWSKLIDLFTSLSSQCPLLHIVPFYMYSPVLSACSHYIIITIYSSVVMSCPLRQNMFCTPIAPVLQCHLYSNALCTPMPSLLPCPCTPMPSVLSCPVYSKSLCTPMPSTPVPSVLHIPVPPVLPSHPYSQHPVLQCFLFHVFVLYNSQYFNQMSCTLPSVVGNDLYSKSYPT